MDEFGDSFESDSSFDSGMDLGGSESFDSVESFESFDMPEMPLEETAPSTEVFDEPPLEDFSADAAELPFDEVSPLEEPDIVPNDISDEMETLDAIEDDPTAMLDKAPEEDISYFEEPPLEDIASEQAEIPEPLDSFEEPPLEETVPESFENSEVADTFEEPPLEEPIPESAELPETSDDFEELPFDETVTPEMPETDVEPEAAELQDEVPESFEPAEDMAESETVEPAEDSSGLENYDYETAPETLDDENPESAIEDKQYGSVAEYLSDHNYGQGDFETYSQDPEWRELMRNEYPDYELPELDPENAKDQLTQYMNDHNYGIEDYDEYSQDPTWRELHSTVFPDDELPPLNEETAETVEPGTDYLDPALEETGDIESPEAVSEDFEEAPEAAEEVAETPEIEEPSERIYDDFEQMVMEKDPEFYESGSFLEQGINEYGYEGTCGETTQANTLNMLFDTNEFTENKVLDVAVENGLCNTEGDPEMCGGTTTEQFMDLYDKMNEQMDGKISAELYEFDDALGVEEVAEQLEDGKVINVAVDSNALWGYSDYVDEMGVPVDDVVSDHWITVTGVERNDMGQIEGFNILDSGGGEQFVTADKYHDICFGTDEHKVVDPTTIVVSKAEDAHG